MTDRIFIKQRSLIGAVPVHFQCSPLAPEQRRILMSPHNQSTDGVWNLLEQLYLDSADSQGKANYTKLSDEERKTILLQFADAQAAVSKRWAEIVHDLRIIGLAG
jgi:hypothetical protein